LIGLTARMQIREKLTSSTIIHQLTTENNGIVFDNTYKTITINIPEQVTTNLAFTSGVYNLEFISGGEVYTFAKGSVSLEKEVTR
jgi:hypothetical protein